MSGRRGSSNGVEQGVPQPGGNTLGRERVSDIQRSRMLGAMVGEVAERGVGNVSVSHVVARSGVSRRTFYEIFEDREDCFLAAFDEAVGRIADVVIPAHARPGSWPAKTRAALAALLELFEDEPDIGRLVVVESLGAGVNALERRTRVLVPAVEAIDQGRAANKAGVALPGITAEIVVGGVLGVLHARLTAGERRPLIELLNPLMVMIVFPYLGRAAADRELDRPVSPRRRDPPRSAADPLRGLEMRLTYRTVRALLAVAKNPGSSNRTVADASGISDQGQISRLLTRLHGLGLIENAGSGPARGEPNAWTLTQRGWEVHGAIAQQTSDRSRGAPTGSWP
jgi:AcrR family transcriptional regulator